MEKSSNTREHLAIVAAHLFYTEGVTACGVDKVVRQAGISKPTLYSHYRSKAELVAAALDFQHQSRRRMLEDYLNERSQLVPEQRLLAVFDWLEEWSRQQGIRGCAFLNAAAELSGSQDESARRVVIQHKQWWQSLLADLARDAGAKDPVRLADELLLLMDGVSARVLVTGNAQSAGVARRVAHLLLQESRNRSYVSPPPSPGSRDDDGGDLEK